MLEKNINISEFETDDAFIVENDFSEHGNEVEEIISKKPPFIVRWGTTFFSYCC